MKRYYTIERDDGVHLVRPILMGVISLELMLLILMSVVLGLSTRDATSGTDREDAVMKDPQSVSDAVWKQQLTPMQFKVLRKKGTERAGTGKYNDHHVDGKYMCAGCGSELFQSGAKFESGTGWPSFTQPAKSGAIKEEEDRSMWSVRTEVLCSRCGGHLGHVFPDGPEPTGLRYCVNSAALDFVKGEQQAGAEATVEGYEYATFGAGCFWCTEAVFEALPGVESVESGYMGGHIKNPTYRQIGTGDSGHTEVSRIKYRPAEISFNELLSWFWRMHDPTTPNRQGNDVGYQYRSVVFCHSDAQTSDAEAMMLALAASGSFKRKIVTSIEPAARFYKAEEYHQDYYRENPNQGYCGFIIRPKLKKLGLEK